MQIQDIPERRFQIEGGGEYELTARQDGDTSSLVLRQGNIRFTFTLDEATQLAEALTAAVPWLTEHRAAERLRIQASIAQR